MSDATVKNMESDAAKVANLVAAAKKQGGCTLYLLMVMGLSGNDERGKALRDRALDDFKASMDTMASAIKAIEGP